MQKDTILSIRRDAKKLIKKYDLDYEGYQLFVSLTVGGQDETNDVYIDINYYNNKGEKIATSPRHVFAERALNDFEGALSLAAARMNSVTGLTL